MPATKRYAAVLASVIALTTAPPADSAETEPSPALLEAANCMAHVLQNIPGASKINLRLSDEDGPHYPIVEYTAADQAGRRRFTEVRLFEIPGALTRFVFDRADIAGDPAGFKALPIWTARCAVSAGYITSYPGSN